MEHTPEEEEKLGAILGSRLPVGWGGGGRHSVVGRNWLYSHVERGVTKLVRVALGTARRQRGCWPLPVGALPAARDGAGFPLSSSAIDASFEAVQQGERWLFGVHLIRTIRYIPALATQTDTHATGYFSAVDRHFGFLFVSYSARAP